MGKEKGGFLTPKAIANRIKAKGLQKLRWYCEMCQKQCRDENGFKCHMTSESHQRQLLLFAENPDEYIDSFSNEFAEDFLEVLRRRCGTKRIHANIVYQEYIATRNHVHMNSTQWETLTDFVKWLGREGKCVVDLTEKGWFITYIDRDPETIKRQESIKQKEKMDMDDEERTSKFIQKQIEKAAASEKCRHETEFTDLKREDTEEKVVFAMPTALKKSDQPSTSKLTENVLKKVSESKEKPELVHTPKTGQKRKSALEEIMEFEEKTKEKKNRKDYWLHKDIVVKIIFKKLGEKYYKKKGYIKEVKDLYTGYVKMLDSGDTLKIDQTHVETVIPSLGKTVMICNGAYRGQTASLEELNEKKFSCTIKLDSGVLKGRPITNVQYEDISKLHQPS
ncbi:hypothetical protein LOTGIDRAFT_236286 [Lottia gigantea]|uniref:C2H2-type domain-containing protein n=1 Tax=Lottia gigantea TaxID=225164 RepID=V3ZP78_LOTGI|nr:hypothetical protein LOTGIDRAFT_236286 [Lottia gigantea]ESO84305.1 hypothetical protein LOTGIDRAFT_236286 [Lottia gigantea]